MSFAAPSRAALRLGPREEPATDPEDRPATLARAHKRRRREGSHDPVESLRRGGLHKAREMCAALVALVSKYHRAIADRALPLIAACSDLARLEQWALAAPDLDDTEFLRLLGV